MLIFRESNKRTEGLVVSRPGKGYTIKWEKNHEQKEKEREGERY